MTVIGGATPHHLQPKLEPRMRRHKTQSPGARRFTLLSENRDYPPMAVAVEEQHSVERVVWKSGPV